MTIPSGKFIVESELLRLGELKTVSFGQTQKHGTDSNSIGRGLDMT